ncbi:MAG: DEAD/DEAH box helicase [Candidatus Pelethousia sp.]|nr:DEAD/DEAH box helicase [Candidatus Pelethousia sp.]
MNEKATFDQYGLSPSMQRAICAMGFEQATPIQAKAIEPFLAGRDLIVQAPTGTGKTCAFGIPVCEFIDTNNKNAQVLILSPTRELAIQTSGVVKSLTKYKENVRLATLYGGENIQKQLAALRRNPQIIIATPGRLLDHIQRRTAKLDGIQIVVLDEADRMLDMGFKQDLNRILKAVPQQRQTVLFSATLPKEIMEIARSYQRDAQHIAIKEDTLTVKTVEQFYTTVANGAKKHTLLSLLERNGDTLSLVFVNMKHRADKLCKDLKRQGIRAEALHGDVKQQKRERIMAAFRAGEIDVLVATDVAARGIDVSNIDIVINYDLPNGSDCYVHRIGRTGRANRCGTAYTFICPDEISMLGTIMRETKAVITQAEPSLTAAC